MEKDSMEIELQFKSAEAQRDREKSIDFQRKGTNASSVIAEAIGHRNEEPKNSQTDATNADRKDINKEIDQEVAVLQAETLIQGKSITEANHHLIIHQLLEVLLTIETAETTMVAIQERENRETTALADQDLAVQEETTQSLSQIEKEGNQLRLMDGETQEKEKRSKNLEKFRANLSQRSLIKNAILEKAVKVKINYQISLLSSANKKETQDQEIAQEAVVERHQGTLKMRRKFLQRNLYLKKSRKLRISLQTPKLIQLQALQKSVSIKERTKDRQVEKEEEI